MKKLNFSTDIHAPKEDVWATLWEDATYRQWTSAFMEGSYAVSDWKEGSQVLFLDPNGDGMVSRIEKMVPNELMSFKHVGVAKNKKEVPMDEEAKKWSGAMENYRLQQNGEITKLKVDVDVSEEHLEMFGAAFPKAMQKLKELAEKKHETAHV